MAIPRQMSVFWSVLRRLDRTDWERLGAADIVRGRQARKAMIGLPGSGLVVGRLPSGATASTSTASIDDDVALPIRIYRPKGAAGPLPVVVNFHGGGFVSGDARQSEWWCGSIASQAQVVVVSVEYRLAPEFGFPVPPEDCYAATVWVVEHAGELDVDASRLAVMGDSAGGNLAAAVAIMARDRVGPRIDLQVLIYPVVEMIDKFASELENADAPILTKAAMDAFHRIYVLDGQGTDPRHSPMRADHHDLPPALVQTAQHDPLRDQGAAYAQALRDAGVAVRLTNYIDAVHGYISVPGLVPASRQALAEAVGELDAAFDRVADSTRNG